MKPKMERHERELVVYMSQLKMDIPTQGTVRNICIWVSNVS